MKLYIAGSYPFECYDLDKIIEDKDKGIYILESFYYIKDWQKDLIKKGFFKGFMLDSGAYTFMEDSDKKMDWKEYLNNYIDFINEYDIDLFFELDIDKVVGLSKVKELREELENKTGKEPIPVWHRNRGKQNFLQLVKNYDYVAYGAFLTDGVSRGENEKYLPWFIDKAHKHNAKIHALGYTGKNLQKFDFDSVDSAAWIYGNRGKFLYNFDGRKMTKIDLSDKKGRMKPGKVVIHNFDEWYKYQRYLDKQGSSQNPA